MKKLFGLFCFLCLMATTQLMAQLPQCSNDNGLNARIAAIETQGYTQVSNRFYHIAYLVAPTPPYLLGTLEITFVGPYCGPACTPAIRVERFDASVQNSNGNCVWKLGNN